MNRDLSDVPVPLVRPRRARATRALRDLLAETRIDAKRLVMPHFVLPTERGEEPIASLPGISRTGRTDLLRRVEQDAALGIRAVLLFGLPANGAKDAAGSAAWEPEGATPAAVRALKRAFGDDLVVATDVCLCAFTDHGHCGVVRDDRIDNDASLDGIARTALAHAEAGADIVAPSDMMDGRVAAIRSRLDANDRREVAILSHAVKYASAYYGPFREAAGSAPGKGERSGYQMDVRNAREAEREARLDEAEGADFLMVKPALSFLDVIRRVRETSALPLFAYNVSGEYAMVRAAAERGWIREKDVVRENLVAMARAGADAIVTYHARAALEGGWL